MRRHIVNRRIRLQIAVAVGCDERSVIRVLDGETLRIPAVQAAINVQLKKLNIVPAVKSADVQPEAETTPATGTGEG